MHIRSFIGIGGHFKSFFLKNRPKFRFWIEADVNVYGVMSSR